jgi:Tol biopolymer transport system component
VSVINADGTGQVQLTNNDVPNSHPVWSPDGTKILYSDGTPFFGGDDRLHILNPDGSGDVALPFGGQSPDWGSALDGDRDLVTDSFDNCPMTANASQADADATGWETPATPTEATTASPTSRTTATVPNANQADADGDGLGDSCDTDRDGDGHPNVSDNCPNAANPDQADWDGDGQGYASDLDRPPAQQIGIMQRP